METDAGAGVLIELRGLFPDAQTLSSNAIRTALAPGEVMLSFGWSEDVALLLITPRADEGNVQGYVLAADKAARELSLLAAKVRDHIATEGRIQDCSGAEDVATLTAQLIPPAARDLVYSARRLVIIPDGPLHAIPLEVLLLGDERQSGGMKDRLVAAGPEVVYAPSATVYLNRRQERLSRADRLKTGRSASALLLGDPLFVRDKPAEPECPQHGVLVMMTVPGGNADKAGLARGDVLLSYDGQELVDETSLGPAIAAVSQAIESGTRSGDEPVTISYWRAGETKRLSLPPGKLGVRPSPGEPGEGLKRLAMASRSSEEGAAEISATDQIRLHGGVLQPLPGTRREVAGIEALVRAAGGSATELTGEEATISKLEESVSGKRFVHIATHGLTGSAERPYDASLAFTQPATPTPDDIGFLTLDHLIRKWRGKLKDCDLVVLSACDTQRGVKKGDSIMALPWGFFYAGAPTVVASLWKVDDTATALLMMRLYENLLGTAREGQSAEPMSKAAALREAKQWLRGLMAGQVSELCEKHGLPRPTVFVRGEPVAMQPAEALEQPFRDPYYWAAFILIGAPE